MGSAPTSTGLNTRNSPSGRGVAHITARGGLGSREGGGNEARSSKYKSAKELHRAVCSRDINGIPKEEEE
jgi:hypothetical protein